MKKSLIRATARLAAMLMTIAAMVTGMGAIPGGTQQSRAQQPEKYTWLENIHGERHMSWVKAENARTAGVLERDTHFLPLQAEALSIRRRA